MAPRRFGSVRLSVRSPRDGRAADRARPVMPWWLAAVVGAVAVTIAGWLAAAGLVVLGWLTAMSSSLFDAVRAGTQAWLLVHGAGGRFGDRTVTLVPLGLTLVVGLLLSGAASFAARQAALERAADELGGQRWPLALKSAGVTAATYCALVTVVAAILATPQQLGRAFVGSAILGTIAALAGALPALGCDPTARWPAWLRAVPRAVAAAVTVLVAAGTVAAIVQLARHAGRMGQLQHALDPGPIATVVLVGVQLVWAPTIVLWATSWVLGAGFTLGDGSVVSMASTHVGLLPGVPVLGAVPANGAGSPWLDLWLLVGVVAGVAAALLVVRARPGARFDETALIGGLSGVLAGLVVTGLAALARGDLGVARLAGLGPRLVELLVMACTTLGLAGMAAGLVLGLLRRPIAPGDPAENTRLLTRR